MDRELVYLRMKRRKRVPLDTNITVRDVAAVSTSEHYKTKIEQTVLYKVTKEDHEYMVIDSFKLTDGLQKMFPEIECQHIGFNETIIQIEQQKEKASIFRLLLAWVILFIGAAMTIINFHYDVNMQEVQQKIHYLLTNEYEQFPLWLQIPYSIGLGIGMILFLNHWFKKRINEEPSPLEIELHKYEQEIDNYIRHFENELNDEERHF